VDDAARQAFSQRVTRESSGAAARSPALHLYAVPSRLKVIVPLSEEIVRERKAPSGMKKLGRMKGWLDTAQDLKPVHA
jgi:hypothetical protein